MSTVCEQNVFESRWGFHPCDYPTYLKLKEIGKYFYRARSVRYEWERWERKDPQNRVLRKWIRDEQGKRCGCEVIGPKPEPKVCPLFARKRDRWIQGEGCGCYVVVFENEKFVEAYQNARYPRAKDCVKSLNVTPHEIDEFLAKCREWFGQ